MRGGHTSQAPTFPGCSASLAAAAPIEGCTWSPDADVFERRGVLVARIDLPGIPLPYVHVEVSEDEVIVSGQRPPETRERGDLWSYAERAYGRFLRVISLPAGAWPEKARATFGDGVLEIKVPVMTPDARLVSPFGADRTNRMVPVRPV